MTEIETEPTRETTEARRCPDCGRQTTHLVLVWPFSATAECLECGWVREVDA